MTVLRKGVGRKRFYGVLNFSTTGFFWEYFLFYRQLSTCTRALFRLFTRSFGHSVHTSCHPNCCPKTPTLLLRPEFDMRFACPFTATSVFKTDILYSYLLWRKGCYFHFRVLANHLGSFFFLQPVRRFVRTTICPNTPFVIRPVTECKHLLAFILTRICFFGREELTYSPHSSFNGQSLAAC